MDSNRHIARRFGREVLNQGRIDSAGRFFWEDSFEQVPLRGAGACPGGWQGVLRGRPAAFPDRHWTVEERIAER